VLTCALNRVEVMGRDVSVVCTHPECENAAIRAIISTDNAVDTTSGTVRFDIKPNKLDIFGWNDQLRIPIKER